MSNFPLPGGRGDNKNLGESFACWWEAQVKMSKFNFLTLKCIFHLLDFLQSVSQSVRNHVSSKTALTIFMKLHLKLWCLKIKKVKELDFLRKISFQGKSPKISSK